MVSELREAFSDPMLAVPLGKENTLNLYGIHKGGALESFLSI